MPTNLPPQYFDVEKKLKAAREPREKIVIMEELLSIIHKHKGTEKLQAMYKTKIAKLKAQMQKKPAGARHSASFHIEKAGAGQIILTAPPNAGKSSLIQALTNAEPDIGEYPFTTHSASPAMMKYENIQIQLIDTPPITPEYFEFWQAEMIKSADGTLILVDLGSPDPAFDFLILLEKLLEKKIEIIPGLLDSPELGSCIMKKALIIANKADLPHAKAQLETVRELIPSEFDPLLISTLMEKGLDELKEKIFSLLDVLRVYSKTPGKKFSREDPFIFKIGSTITDMAKSVHKDFAQKLRYARIWGKGKYQGQKVNRDYELQDEDIIELHI